MITAVAAMGRPDECPSCAPGGCCPVCGDAPDATSGDHWECSRCDAYFSTLADCQHLDAVQREARENAAVHVYSCQLGCSTSRPRMTGMVEFVAAEGCDDGLVLLAAAQPGDHL